jgi:hypothetical protein
MNNYNIFIILIISIILLISIIIITCYFNKIEKFTNKKYGLTCDDITTITANISSEINRDYEIFKFIHNNDNDNNKYTEYEFTLYKSILADILIVGGGGGGGSNGIKNGGGGGGGVLYMTNKQLLKGIYKIRVGNGGESNWSGNDSFIKYSDDTYVTYDNIKLIGKGGGSQNEDGGSSGGGGSGKSRREPGSATQGETFWNGFEYIAGGFSGGNGIKGNGGGGGGAGAVGMSKGDGGDGREVNITGVSLYYGGGGGGSPGRKGGEGGGGRAASRNVNGQAGESHTGGGGGAYYDRNKAGGKGGSGIVIIRKITPNAITNLGNDGETNAITNLGNDVKTNAITNLGNDVVLWHDGTNIDNNNNSTLSDGETITSWFNKSSSSFTTTTTLALAPSFNQSDSGLNFMNDNVLNSDINLNKYPTMNIFVVWKPSASHTNLRWLWSQSSQINNVGGRTLILYTSSGTQHLVGNGYSFIKSNFNFSENNVYVVNCEYNTNGLTGKFYVNNQLDKSFTSYTPYGAINTVFGAMNNKADTYVNTPTGITGDIYEIIIINRLLTSTERTNIYNYLDSKWKKN